MTIPRLESLERLAASELSEPPGPVRRLLVVVNPYATTVSDRLKHLVVYALRGRYEVHAVDTERKEHAVDLAREAAREGYDAIVAFGGDGTVNEAANGLAGSDTALTCLPGGATNVYCKMLGIPGDVVDATEHLLAMADRWEPRRVDLARVNGRHFTFSAGLGLDASVVERVDANPRLKARLGPWYFTSSAVTTFFRRYLVNPPQLGVELDDGRVLRGVTAIVQNGDPYTYFENRPVRLVRGVALDDGQLGGVVLDRANPLDTVPILTRALSERWALEGHRHVDGFRGEQWVHVTSLDGRPVPLQVDGDPIGAVTDAEFGLTPRGLLVVS